MNPINPLIKYGIAALIAGLFVSVVYYQGYERGKKNVQNAWDISIKNQAVLAAKIADDNVKKVTEAQDITVRLTNDYEAKINDIKQYYIKHPVVLPKRMCNPAADTNTTSKIEVSATANGTNDSAANTVPVTQIDWSTLPSDCAQTTQQLISLQSWITTEVENFNKVN